MICKNCGGEFSEEMSECPYCGTENAKEAEEQQREYIQEYQNKKEELKNMPDKIAKKGKLKVTKILIFSVVAVIIIGVIAFYASKLMGKTALIRQDEQLTRLEELYQAKDFENLEIYYEKYNVRGGSFEKYNRVIELYSRTYIIDSIKSTCEYVSSYSQEMCTGI